jgi:hypothetical protein
MDLNWTAVTCTVIVCVTSLLITLVAWPPKAPHDDDGVDN